MVIGYKHKGKRGRIKYSGLWLKVLSFSDQCNKYLLSKLQDIKGAVLSQKRHTRAGVRYYTSRPWAGELFPEAVLKFAAGIKTGRWEKQSKTPAPMVAPWGNRDQPVQRQRGFQERSVSGGLSIPTGLLSVGLHSGVAFLGLQSGLVSRYPCWIFTAQLR